MIKINPILLLKGLWHDGYALDLHTLESEWVGFLPNGRDDFNTKRTPMGELVYRLKYRHDRSALDEIVDVTADYISNWWKLKDKIDLIIPVPSSSLTREFQHVNIIAMSVGRKLGVPARDNVLVKVKLTDELKNIKDYEARRSILKGAFTVRKSETEGKNILLFDDLYRSGATLRTITDVLRDEGKAKTVYVLTLTKTRTKS